MATPNSAHKGNPVSSKHSFVSTFSRNPYWHKVHVKLLSHVVQPSGHSAQLPKTVGLVEYPIPVQSVQNCEFMQFMQAVLVLQGRHYTFGGGP